MREFLAARVRWRRSGLDSYQYELERPNQFYWQGRITVTEGAVSEFETLQLEPPFAEAPPVPTIDELFERVAAAIANSSDSIEVAWDPVRGYPGRCVIDPRSQVADDEERWNISQFTPLP